MSTKASLFTLHYKILWVVTPTNARSINWPVTSNSIHKNLNNPADNGDHLLMIKRQTPTKSSDSCRFKATIHKLTRKPIEICQDLLSFSILHDKKSKIGISVASQKGLMSFKNKKSHFKKLLHWTCTSHMISASVLYNNCVKTERHFWMTQIFSSLLKSLPAKGVESERFCISLFEGKRLINTFLI